MNSTKYVYLLFYGSKEVTQTFLHKDFQHIKCITRDPNIEVWFSLTPRFDRLNIEVQNNLTDSNIESIIKGLGAKVLRVEITNDERIKNISFNFFNLINCVSIAKYIIGLKSWVQTPKQLYYKLIKDSINKNYHSTILNIDIIKGE